MANKSRPKQLSFRVSEEEWELLQQKISESGMNQQRYILSCVLGKEIVNTDGIKEIVPELKRTSTKSPKDLMSAAILITKKNCRRY